MSNDEIDEKLAALYGCTLDVCGSDDCGHRAICTCEFRTHADINSHHPGHLLEYTQSTKDLYDGPWRMLQDQGYSFSISHNQPSGMPPLAVIWRWLEADEEWRVHADTPAEAFARCVLAALTK